MARDFYTTAEAADALQCTARTVRRYVATGRLDGLRLPGKTLVRRDAIVHFLNAAADIDLDQPDEQEH